MEPVVKTFYTHDMAKEGFFIDGSLGFLIR